MPPLSTMLKTQSLPGFEGVDKSPALPVLQADREGSGLNPYLRCPLPPFSTTIDTIRQWNMTGKNPVMRVIPLPNSPGTGGSQTTFVTGGGTGGSGVSGAGAGVVIVSGGGGGGSVTPAAPLALLPLTVFFNVPFLGPQGTYTTTIHMSESFQLLQISATQPVEVRLYSNPTTQTQDIARLTDIAVPFDNIEGVITDIVFDTVLVWDWQNRIGANADTPQTVNIYVTVVNPSATTGVAPSTVTVVYQPLES